MIDEEFLAKVRTLRPRQLTRVVQLVDALVEGCHVDANPNSDFADESFCSELGDQLRLHHNASAIPLTKDKFEYAIVSAFNDSGHVSEKLGNGNPGADIRVDGDPWSLKTQADASIKADRLHISKMMELGRGAWDTAEDVEVLREKLFGHLTKYTRIMSLRCLSRVPNDEGVTTYLYELVEIPKALLQSAEDFPIEMKVNSKQTPKPASCYVKDASGDPAFELYFDGGTERKLQVKALMKKNCTVHATWTFTASA